MSELNSDILALLGQAVLLVRGGTVLYANPAAAATLGYDCRGKKLAKVLNAEIAGCQSSDFVANALVNGKDYTVHSVQRGSQRILLLKETEMDYVTINESFLSAIRSNVMLLSMSAEICRTKAEENSPAELAEALATMNKSVAAASRIVANISTVQELFHNDLCFTMQNVDLSLLCKSCIEAMKDLMPEVSLRLSAPPLCIMNGDPKLLVQLLMNLLSNSICHGKSRNIEVRLMDDSDRVLLSVSDDGIGIRSDGLTGVFERYRDKPTLQDMGRGCGFGLTVVRGIARRHGGTMLLESHEDRGTLVSVVLHKNVGRLSLHSMNKYEIELKELLIWAADCLPERCYAEKYMD